MRKIKIIDYSLKALSDKNLLFREKTAIAENVDNFGVDAIELPAAQNIKEDAIIYGTISSVAQNSEICLPVGFDEEKIGEVFECIKSAKKPCLQVAVPVSTTTMEYTYHYKADKMLKKVDSLVKAAKKYCKNIEFVAMDATRADKEYLTEIINTAKNAGATAATVCDDAGIMTPEAFGNLIKTLTEKCDLPIYVKVSNELNMAVACAYYAVLCGASGIKASVSGENELKTADIAAVLEAQKDALQISFNLKTTQLKNDIGKLKKVVKKVPETSETSASDDGLLISAESTLADIEKAAKALGYELSGEDIGKVYKSLVPLFEKRTGVGTKELEAIIAIVANEAPSTYHLDTYNINISNVSSSMANVVLKKDDTLLAGIATGDGPIDAAFLAIEQGTGLHYELDGLEISAVTEGKEALGSAVVRLRSEGVLYSGTGLSSDIVGASIRAYINALNKIVYEEGLA
ncbi:MAG: hypothetical protein MJ080_00825 [Clostridia bacterium]|nr:hypothetical protein [Clostridia bacterium]